MDINLFYALFSATCFTLVGLWWNLLQEYPGWLREPVTRRAVGGVYLSFLLPALMGLFAQVGGEQTPLVWRVSFVGIAIIGALTTLRALAVSDRDDRPDTLNRVAALALYVLIAVIGVAPEAAKVANLKPIQAEAILLILLVVLAHGLVWRFMTTAPAGGAHERVE
jgi:hypothetical protein